MKTTILLSCIAVALTSSLAANEKPNILIYFADDMGIGDTRVYSVACPVELPTLEKLAKQGMSFSDAHAQASLCAPSRYSILSGNYPHRGRSEGGSWNFNGGSQFLDGQKTLADILKAQGYRTAMFGKVHLGALVHPKDPSEGFDKRTPHTKGKKHFDWNAADFTRPLKNGLSSKGFDYTFLSYGGIQDAPYAFFENDILYGKPGDLMVWEGGNYKNDNGISNIQGWKPGFGLPDWKTNEVGPILTGKAIDFIDRHHTINQRERSNTPFFMHYCSQAVHVPHTPPKKFHGRKIFGATGGTKHMDMLLEMDVSFGMILDELEQRGLLDNTLIIFTSDNGGLPQKVSKNTFNSNEGLQGYKAQMWEGGHRVPFIIRWGDGTPKGSKVPPGTWSRQLVGIVDIYATVCDLLGVSPGADQGLDSRSFLSALLKQNETPIRRHLLHSAERKRSIRDGAWKLVTTQKYEPLSLFNLADDPVEANDLITNPEHAPFVKKLASTLKELKEAPRSTPEIGKTR